MGAEGTGWGRRLVGVRLGVTCFQHVLCAIYGEDSGSVLGLSRGVWLGKRNGVWCCTSVFGRHRLVVMGWVKAPRL